MKKIIYLLFSIFLLAGCSSTQGNNQNKIELQEIKEIDIEKFVNNELLGTLKMLPEGELTIEGLPSIRSIIDSETYDYKDNIAIDNKIILGYKDAGNVEIRIFTPSTKIDNSSVIIMVHSGGYVVGSIDSSANYATHLAQSTNLPVISFNYSLAPEKTYPNALYDAYAVLKYVNENADELNIDNKKIITYGTSAGGGLCAALNLYTRDINGPKPMLQVLLQPMLDYRNTTQSSYEIVDSRIWSRSKNIFGWNQYLGNQTKDEITYTASPSLCEDLSNLPPTFLTVGTMEVFRDEVMEYAKKLATNHVPVEFHLYNGSFHGSENFVPEAKISKNQVNDVINYINEFLANN
jgi:acetyl esterase/lipase